MKERNCAVLNPDEFLSVIIDGECKGGVGLLHLSTPPEKQKAYSIKVGLVGLFCGGHLI